MTSLVPTASWGPSITVSHSWSKSGPSRGLLRSAFNQISSHVIWLRTKSLPKVPPRTLQYFNEQKCPTGTDLINLFHFGSHFDLNALWKKKLLGKWIQMKPNFDSNDLPLCAENIPLPKPYANAHHRNELTGTRWERFHISLKILIRLNFKIPGRCPETLKLRNFKLILKL